MTLPFVIPNSPFDIPLAFLGVLVPQAPNDEPATSLLKRLSARRTPSGINVEKLPPARTPRSLTHGGMKPQKTKQ
jgi:hypothetical protein